jgi:RHH-type transcriptional regulator, proline utilization regulon repressor / proline dehydrogenase / delta 1-pyrroline-5-carboxylate dehydrogenase
MRNLSTMAAAPKTEQAETPVALPGTVAPSARSDVSEHEAAEALLAELRPLERRLSDARLRARFWVEAARARRRRRSFADALLARFPLGSEQGRALMSLAEALLRTPDAERADQLIAERLDALRLAEPAPIGARSLRFGLALLGSAGRLLPDVADELAGRRASARVLKPVLAPLLRTTLRRSMARLGASFIVGDSIETALARSRSEKSLALCSFDMLGEAARTEADAQRFFDAYAHAIEALALEPRARSGISVKLSALEPRYVLLQRERVQERLVPRVMELARRAARAGIPLTIDAEEADRLELSLEVIDSLARDAATRTWSGLGLAVQAYDRRALGVIERIARLARESARRMHVRLVKGAYWDTEIKRAQERGLAAFPVYTAKAATDASYLACAARLFTARDCLYPQFATHNALTVAAVLELAPVDAAFEFQRLYGMGEALYESARASAVGPFPAVRVYAPVGSHSDLLPYLVRRLLENGANTSFVHRFLDPAVPVEQVVSDPLAELKQALEAPGRVREPRELYAPDRTNSRGIDWGDARELDRLVAQVRRHAGRLWSAEPLLSARAAVRDRGAAPDTAAARIVSPANTAEIVGTARDATPEEITRAIEAAALAQPGWDSEPAGERAARLERAAHLLEERRDTFVSLLVREAGRTLPDSVAEVREAADFCRYYAARARELFDAPRELPGPAGERNLLSLHGRGVFLCVSPWNFPLSIFTGQIAAALAAGNAVVAKPAPATPLVACAMTRLLHEAGIPGGALQLTPAEGPPFGEVAFRHPALGGVVFTGSTATASVIQRALALRNGPIVPLIAETGGVNAMIVDSTALPEQVVDDAVTSAFTSAGQRCSALRVLYLQEEIADRVIEMLIGAMKCLTIGDPADPATDVGPVISSAAVERLNAHAERMRAEAELLYACRLDEPRLAAGHFFPPHLFQLRALDQLRTEEFGPILHVARYRAAELPQVIDAVRGTGFGLTLGVQSRLDGFAEHVFRSLAVGNTYVNRNMIGAVVGVQPFGGQGLSGTGPKAGGPYYLLRFATERTLTINTAAIGGDLDLLSRPR